MDLRPNNATTNTNAYLSLHTLVLHWRRILLRLALRTSPEYHGDNTKSSKGFQVDCPCEFVGCGAEYGDVCRVGGEDEGTSGALGEVGEGV